MNTEFKNTLYKKEEKEMRMILQGLLLHCFKLIHETGKCEQEKFGKLFFLPKHLFLKGCLETAGYSTYGSSDLNLTL